VRGPDAGWLSPILGGAIGIDCYWGRCLSARCRLCIIECIASASTLIIPLQNSMYQNLNSNYNIFIFITLNLWFVCVYLWIFASSRILRRDPIWHPYFYDGDVTTIIMHIHEISWVNSLHMQATTFSTSHIEYLSNALLHILSPQKLASSIYAIYILYMSNKLFGILHVVTCNNILLIKRESSLLHILTMR
jgi:hypothetical protein